MMLRRKLLVFIGTTSLSVATVPAHAQQTQSSRPPASATQAVDAAVRSGRIDRRVAAEVAYASSDSPADAKPVRALLVTTPRQSEGETFEAQQEVLAADKSELTRIPGVRVDQLLPSLNTTVIEISSAEGLAALAALPDATIVADELLQRSDSESEQYVQAPVVRSYGYNGAGTYIGIIDSGLDYSHSDLGSCSVPGAPAPCRVAILAPDFSHNADGSLYNDGVADDSIRHGTNVAATASAMAPGAKIIGTDVFGATGAYASDVAAAIQYMINLKNAGYPIVAVNLSLGNRPTTCVDTLGASALRNAGILAVAAAGNAGYVNGVFTPGLSNPACVPGVVSVGATLDANYGPVSGSSCTMPSSAPDQVACFSQVSSGLSVLAPGTFISAGGVTMSGTSQAAPHVAGAIATLSSAVPQATAADLAYGVTTSSVQVFDTRIGLSFPRLSMPSALAATQSRIVGASGPESFDRAVVLSGASGTVSTAAGFTAQASESTHGRRTGISSTWFAWTAPSSGRASFSTSGSSFDTAMSVYTGTALNGLTEVGSNDDTASSATAASVGPIEVVSGQSYRIAVSCGVASASCGTINFSWTASADQTAPPNDRPQQAQTIGIPASGAASGNNTFSTSQSGEPPLPGGVAPRKSIWYKYVSPGSNVMTFTTAGTNYDTTLSIFEGADPSSLRPLASHNDIGQNGAKFDATSAVSITTLRTPTTYWISIDSPTGQTGTSFLNWSTTSSGAPQSGTVSVSVTRVRAPGLATPTTPTARRAATQAGADPVTIL
jgi:subtilisin family serine protease